MEILRVDQLSFVRSQTKILDSISFSISKASVVGLTGPNGGGKSTLFEILMGWHRLQRGSIVFSSNPRCSLLPQIASKPQNLPLNVRSFVEMGTWGKQRTSSALDLESVLDRLGLRPIEKVRVSELSGGQWKKACLARTLVQAADLYFLDEPFNHLDLASEDQVGQLITELSKRHSKTFFIVSHDWHAMNHYFDRVILMNRKILADGKVDEVSKVYLNWLDPKHHEWIHSS